MVVPQTESGQPATSGAMRAMFQPCSPTWVTQPICTSSISPGSRSCRATRPFNTCAQSSSPRIDERVPFRFPIGERTASTMYASVIDDTVEAPLTRDALQLARPAILEHDTGAGHEVPHRPRDEDLAWG